MIPSTTVAPIPWREIRALASRYRGPLALALALVVVNRLAALVLPAGSKYVIDDVIGRQRVDLLLPIGLAVGAAILCETASTFALTRVTALTAQRAILTLRCELHARVLGLPVGAFDVDRSGAFVSRLLADPEQLRSVLGTGMMNMVGGVCTSVLVLGVLFWLNAPLTAIVLLLLACAGVGLARGFAWLAPTFHAVHRLTAEIGGRLAEVLGGIRTVKTYSAERRETYRFARESHRLFRGAERAITGSAVITATSTLVSGAIGVLLLLMGGRAVAAGTMTLGELVMYVFLVGLLSTPLVQIASGAGELGKVLGALRRIAELRAIPTEEEEDRPRIRLGPIAGLVDVQRVSYAYVPGRPVLRDVSFQAAPGTITALVGPSGAGKSTLASLLLGWRSPTSGRIFIDHIDLAAVRRRDYRRQLGIVLQEDALFDGTVADNIRYGRPEATLAEVMVAARLAHCDEFVERFPDSYATLVGERGVRLSPGQRQRVAIARALVADPRILVLDEATSSLDAESELLIQDGLRVLCGGRTTFVIAHRLSTIRRADQILVLEQGRIVERGTHEDLLTQEGRYWRMVRGQERGIGVVLPH